MIYEMRTYDLKPRSVDEVPFQRREDSRAHRRDIRRDDTADTRERSRVRMDADSVDRGSRASTDGSDDGVLG